MDRRRGRLRSTAAEQRDFPRRHQTRNMLNHPIVQKDYVFTANFAQQFRYNEQALVYSGLLARNTAFSGGNAGLAKRKRVFRTVQASNKRLWAQPQVKV